MHNTHYHLCLRPHSLLRPRPHSLLRPHPHSHLLLRPRPRCPLPQHLRFAVTAAKGAGVSATTRAQFALHTTGTFITSCGANTLSTSSVSASTCMPPARGPLFYALYADPPFTRVTLASLAQCITLVREGDPVGAVRRFYCNLVF